MKMDETVATKETDAAAPAGTVAAGADDITLTTAPGTPTPEGAAASPEQIEAWRTQAAQAAENWDRYLRAVAELDNFRKRAAREKAEAAQFANESLLSKLLGVLDHFEMALAAAAEPTTTIESLKSGVDLIQGQLRQALSEAGLEEVDALGQAFDPNLHEAVSQLESADAPEGQVLHQLRRGYRLRGRLLRPASVVVAKSPAA